MHFNARMDTRKEVKYQIDPQVKAPAEPNRLRLHRDELKPKLFSIYPMANNACRQGDCENKMTSESGKV